MKGRAIHLSCVNIDATVMKISQFIIIAGRSKEWLSETLKAERMRLFLSTHCALCSIHHSPLFNAVQKSHHSLFNVQYLAYTNENINFANS